MGQLIINRFIKPRRLWILPIVFFVAQQSYALGLGDIQVNSYLGEPLKAQVDFVDLGNDYESNLKVRLASPDEYKKSGYAYPYDIKFRFNVINETGRQPTVRISSSQVIEDPFLNLLLEISSPSGKIVKVYTFLIDPSPDMLHSQSAIQTPHPTVNLIPVTRPERFEPSVVAPNNHAALAKTAAHSIRNNPPTLMAAVQSKRVRQSVDYKSHNSDAKSYVSNKLSLSLSTSLSISSADPSRPLNARENNDVLQEELIAKEKTLSELNSQILEMHNVIANLQSKLSLTAASSVNMSSVVVTDALALSTVSSPSASLKAASSKVKVVSPVVVDEGDIFASLTQFASDYRKPILAGLSVLGLAGAAFFMRRKRKLESGWIPGGLFDDLSPLPSHTVDTINLHQKLPDANPPPIVTKTALGDQSIKTPAYKEQKAQPTLPPEYDLLEEADIYLRFGHDKLAEEVLRDALKINAANPEIYMSLLGIFDTRVDAKGFADIATIFKPVANPENWAKVVEMGKKLDLGNPLYG